MNAPMKLKFRLLSVVLAMLAFSNVGHATFSDCGETWFNHPVVTSASAVIGWKSKYTGAYKKGAAVPQDNINAIKQYVTDLTGWNCFGGSFKVYYSNGISVRGYINVKVVNGAVSQVTFTSSALYRIFS
jgi:hypothetical protein